MTRHKRWLFIFIVVVLSLFLVYSLFLSKTKLTLENRNRTDNPAKEIILSQGDYKVGKDIKPGYYDIICIDGKISFSNIWMYKKEKLLNQPIEDNTLITIEGQGKLKFIPAKFSPVSKGHQSYIIQHSGYYLVGKDIPEGFYQFIMSKNSGLEAIGIYLFSDLNSDNNSEIYELTKAKRIQNVKLDKGNLLDIEIRGKHKKATQMFIYLVPLNHKD